MVRDLTKGNPTKLLLGFSWPVMIGNIFQQLYNMADTVIVGKTLGKTALAAVGATGGISFLVLGFILGLTSGFSVVTSQRFGAGDEEGVRRSFAATILLSLAFVVITTLLSVFTTMPLLRLMDTPESLMQGSYDYIIVIYYGIFAQVFYNAISNVIRALGDSRTPLYFLLFASVLNVGLDFLCILTFRMGVAGAAYATVAAQLIAALACAVYCIKKFPILRLKKEDWKLPWRFLWEHLAIGLPMALQFSVTAVGIIVLQRAINTFGENAVAGYTAAIKLEQVTTCVLLSLGSAMATYTGQNFGAGRFDRIRSGVRRCSVLALLTAVISAGLVLGLGRYMVLLFVDPSETAVIGYAMETLWVLAPFYPALGLLFVYRNALQGMGHSWLAMIGGAVELVMRFLVCSLLLAQGFAAVCLAGPIAWVGAALWLMLAYLPVKYRAMKRYRPAQSSPH